MPKTQAPLPESAWRKLPRTWNAFWFTPRDPTLLGLIRICCGAVTFYTVLMYSFELENFVGPKGWIDQRWAAPGRQALTSLLEGAALVLHYEGDHIAVRRASEAEVVGG